jgi:DNA-binding NarL/FixJ family response regulator
MAETIKIAIVDDHPLFKDGAERALKRQRDFVLVGSGLSAADAIDITREKHPDVLLLDVGLPGGGIAAVKSICALGMSTKVVMLTGLDDEQILVEAISAGAVGYILKGIEASELAAAIRMIHRGHPYITPALSTRLLVKEMRPAQRSQSRPMVELSQRERQLLDLAARGMTNSDIAAELDLALPTVKNSMSRMFEKLGVRNRAEAIAVALGDGRTIRKS